MNWQFKIGRILGIDVFLHVTFLLVLGFLAVSHWLAHGTLAAVISGAGFFVALFVCVLLHEYGHALMARRFGVATRDITLLPIGGVARLERMPEKSAQELWVALAGPAVNIAIAAVLGAWLLLTGTWQPLNSLGVAAGGFVERLMVVNLFLALFNIIPAFPMDGGRVLRALLAMRLEYARATRIAATIGQTLALVFGIAGLFGNPFLLFIAVFVWLAAAQEAGATEMKAALGDVRVREAMLQDFRTLAPNETLADATRLLLQTSQRDFPVTAKGAVAGMLTHERLFKMLRERGDWTPISEVMEADFPTVRVNQPLADALEQVLPGATAIPVLQGGRIVGLLTAENLGELVMVRAARHSRSIKSPVSTSQEDGRELRDNGSRLTTQWDRAPRPAVRETHTSGGRPRWLPS